MYLNLITIAMGPPPGGGQAEQSPMFLVGWMGIMIAIFYIIAIRPQRRKEQERQSLINNIKSGDRVSFSGGILGTVTNSKEKTFVVKIADKVKIEVARGAVTAVLDKGDDPEGEQL